MKINCLFQLLESNFDYFFLLKMTKKIVLNDDFLVNLTSKISMKNILDFGKKFYIVEKSKNIEKRVKKSTKIPIEKVNYFLKI